MTGLNLLVSYPKSGNTWLRALLTSVWHGGAAVDINKLTVRNSADRQLVSRLLGVNLSDLTCAEMTVLRARAYEFGARQLKQAQFLKMHDAWLPAAGGQGFPLPEAAVGAVLYLVRDPRDVAVSFANHLGKSVDETIEIMNKPRSQLSHNPTGLRWQAPQLLSTWSVHVTSWLNGFEGRIHLVRYEDMLLEPERTLSAALAFVGIRVARTVVRSAIAATHFDSLRAQEHECGFAERPPSSARFFRQGTANAWRNTLSTAQIERVAADHGAVMRTLGYPVAHTDGVLS